MIEETREGLIFESPVRLPTSQGYDLIGWTLQELSRPPAHGDGRGSGSARLAAAGPAGAGRRRAAAPPRTQFRPPPVQ